jgi:biopolymer transport protein ExbD
MNKTIIFLLLFNLQIVYSQNNIKTISSGNITTNTNTILEPKKSITINLKKGGIYIINKEKYQLKKIINVLEQHILKYSKFHNKLLIKKELKVFIKSDTDVSYNTYYELLVLLSKNKFIISIAK